MIETAHELAWALRHDDNEVVFFEQAAGYMAIRREAERRALHHAENGDRLVAYDEALDARWALCTGAVFFVAWLATVANREAHRRAMTLDCGDTNGEQLGMDEGYERYLAAVARGCGACSCFGSPCGGCSAGGFCDGQCQRHERAGQDDEDDEDDDMEDAS